MDKNLNQREFRIKEKVKDNDTNTFNVVIFNDKYFEKMLKKRNRKKLELKRFFYNRKLNGKKKLTGVGEGGGVNLWRVHCFYKNITQSLITVKSFEK